MRNTVKKKNNKGNLVKEPLSPYLSLYVPTQGTRSEFQLYYEGKKTERQILDTQNTVEFKQIKVYGSKKNNIKPNSLFKGDNFSVLRKLVDDPTVTKKIRLIYIDPPFSTQQKFKIGPQRTSTISSSNNDLVAYSDELTGARYLEFLRERLILLRELLADDGSIYLHIDYKIGHHVKLIMDEIFGTKNFLGDITRIKCNPKNFTRKGYGNIKDVILFYSKSKEFVWNEPREGMTEKNRTIIFYD